MTNNTVNPYNSPNIIIITDSDQNQITVTQPVTTLLEVGAVGPQGPKGDSAPFIQIGNTNTWYTTSDIEITGSLTVSGSNTFRNIGLGLFTGSVIITGSALYNGYDILNTASTGSLLTTSSFNAFSSSYVQDSGSFDTRILINSSSITILSGSFLTLSGSFLVASASFDNRINLLSASFEQFSSSYVRDSGSVNTRLTDLEIFSSSLDNTFVTNTELNAATASLSGSIASLSSSYLQSSASFDAGISSNSSSIAILSGSFLTTSASYVSFSGSYVNDSGSFNTRILNNSSSIATLSSSFISTSSSFNTRILNNSSSIATLSSSFISTSSSLNTRVTSLEQFSSSLDATFATDAQLNAATASLSGSISSLSSSYLASSASFDTRILNNSSSIATLSSSFISTSSSFNTRILNNSSSIATLSSSFIIFSGSYNTGSFTGSFTGNGSGLTNIPASGIVGLNLSQIASGSATASISPNNGFQVNTLASFQGPVSASEFTGSGLGIINARIGQPSDGTYSDGFFDTFTPTTTLANALDEISAAFLDLAPAKAPVLTGTNLTRVNPTVFTGYLAGGLNPEWYATASAFTQYTTLTAATNVDLRAIGTRAGKAADISASLVGGVSSSRAYGTNAFSVVDTRPLSSGLGSTNTIDIDGLQVFNTFWAIVTSSIDDTINQTGSVQYRISADNSAGITNAFQYFYVGGASDYPNQTLSGGTSVTSSVTFNYLSGIEYLRTANFAISFTGSNLFNPVYNLNQCSLTSNFFSTLNTGSNNPQYNDVLRLTANRSLLATTHSGQANATCTITATKPGKSNTTLAVTLSNTKINSYTSPVSTNNNNSQTDIFVDEARRYTNLNTASWASSSVLIDGNLQVQNDRLIVGRWGDYGAFLSGSTSAATTYANYFRDSIPGSTNRIAGTFSIFRNTNAFAASTPISAWDSGGRLEAVLVLKSDITGPETANFYYDLGRAVGSNSGTIIGIRNTITTNNTTTYTVTWALPAGVNTGANGCVIWIRYRNTPNTDFIRSLTITYS
jgi:hypothetical protein